MLSLVISMDEVAVKPVAGNVSIPGLNHHITRPVEEEWRKLYVVLDIFSRYMTGWLVARVEDAVVARDFLGDAIARNGAIPHAIHADRSGA